MRRKDLVTTTMALTLAVFMSAVCTGCGHQEEVTDSNSIAVETTTESTIEEGYTIEEVEKPYDAMVSEDCSLLDSSDAVTEITPMTKESYVTVYGDVFKDGVQVDYYAVELDDGTRGFVEGRYLEFNFDVVEDYADSLEEIEGGDGEETTEEVVEETEVIEAEVTEEESTEETEAPEETSSLGYVLTECSPQTKYTNTNANIRATPDKSGTLVNTVSINTEFQVTATTDTGWSRIESNGVVCFIKSSLLSDTKTEVKQPSKTQSNTSQSQTQSQPQASQPQQTQPSQPQQTAPSQPDTSGLPADFFADETPDPGVYGGTTGSTGAGGGMNVE